MRAADVLIQVLKARGVSTVFALSGNQIMPIFDAALGSGIRLVHVRHEAAAGYMAEGYAQISGEVGVALVTAGAGLTNAASALMTAKASQTPLLLISGDSPAGQDGAGAFQEMDQTGLTTSLTKRSLRVTDPNDVATVLREALAEATSGVPGPVHLSMPDDVVRAEAFAGDFAPTAATAVPDPAAVLHALDQSERPLVLLGPMLSETRRPGLPAELEAALDAPVLLLESPRGLKDPSLGNWAALAGEADCVLVLGKPVDYSIGFGGAGRWPDARWHVATTDATELDRARRNLGDRLESAIDCDPAAFARALAERAPPNASREAWRDRARAEIERRPPVQAATGAIASSALCQALARHIADAPDAIFVSDGGEIGQWAQALVKAPRRIINGVAGAIGAGASYAMGAKAAAHDAAVYCLMGDGTAGFHLAEFETAAREGLPFVAVIGNDRRWNAEHMIQTRDYGADRLHGCGLSDARYDLAVAALGGFGAHVTDPADLSVALTEAARSGRPACVNVEIDPEPAPDPPPAPSAG